MQIQSNLMDGAHAAGVPRLLFLGSSCIYPKFAPQPIHEDSLLTGPLEPTNDAYAIAKIAGIRLADGYRSQFGHDWISAMPTNIYGPGDNFDLETSHVLPALLRRFHEAQQSGAESVTLWGTGVALREFLYSEDLAEAVLHLLDHYSEPGPINVGFGEDISIKELATIIAATVGFTGEIRWDATQARRHPAQAARFEPDPRHRLEPESRASRGHPTQLRVVPGPLLRAPARPGATPRCIRLKECSPPRSSR